MGKSKKLRKKTSTETIKNMVTNDNLNISNDNIEVQKTLVKESNKSALKKRIKLLVPILMILVILGGVVFFMMGGNDTKVYKFKKNYVLCNGSHSYKVFAGDSVKVIRGNQIVLNNDTICVPNDKLDIFIDNNDYEKDSYVIKNKNGSGRIFTYTKEMFASKKQLIDISTKDNDKFHAVEGELFEICKNKDEKNGRPYLALGNHILWPNFAVPELIDTVLLTKHKPLKPQKLVIFGDTLVGRFEYNESVGSIGIFSENGEKEIGYVKADGKDFKIFIGKQDPVCYRLCAKGHVSSLVLPAEAELIEVSSLKKESSNFSLVIISIIAIIEFLGIIAILFKLNKRKKEQKITENAAEGLAETDDRNENLEKQIQEKQDLIKSYKEKLIELEDCNGSIHDEVSSVNNFENQYLIYGKKPNSEEEKENWIKQLLEFPEYENEEFIKQIRLNKENMAEPAFKQYVLGDFDKLHTQWEQLLQNKDKDGVEKSNTISLMKEKITLEEANLEILQKKQKDLQGEINTETIESLQALLKEKDNMIEELNTFKQNAEKKIQDANTKVESELEKINEQAQEKNNQANNRAEQAIQESKDTEERVTKEFENQIGELKTANECKNQEIQTLTDDLTSTRSNLESTTIELQSANETISAKDKALERFNKSITDIAPAKKYADSLEKLLVIGDKVEQSAISLGQDNNIDDYLINKYIARYRLTLSSINMQMFITDVLNATKAQFAYKSQMLASFDQRDKETFHESMKLYFYDAYLKKYIDALVVLNETMVGMQYLAEGATTDDVKPFEHYRKEINAILNELEIEMLTVKIMDLCTDNLMLTVIPKELEFDCPKNSICQINNCIVYLKGASKPNEKIQVIVKK